MRPSDAQRHQAILDLAAGQIARGKAAQPDADRQRRPKHAGRAQLAHLQNVLAVINHSQLHQRREEEEIDVPQTGQPQHTVGPHHFDLLPEVAQEIGAELPASGPPPAPG